MNFSIWWFNKDRFDGGIFLIIKTVNYCTKKISSTIIFENLLYLSKVLSHFGGWALHKEMNSIWQSNGKIIMQTPLIVQFWIFSPTTIFFGNLVYDFNKGYWNGILRTRFWSMWDLGLGWDWDWIRVLSFIHFGLFSHKKKKRKKLFYLMIWWGRSSGGENILGPFNIQLIFKFFFLTTIFEIFSLLLLVLPTILQEHILGDLKIRVGSRHGYRYGYRYGSKIGSIFEVYVWGLCLGLG